ncbi:MAG: galactose mutarotase [Oscillibacter sp.]|nr:galactose mutarotase [Oscillibacter sp.]
MKISCIEEKDGATMYLMENDLLKVYLTNFGASIYNVQMKEADGGVTDLTATCDSLESFLQNRVYFGATVGRTINRIKGAAFTLGNKRYPITANSGRNHSNGGKIGFSFRLWEPVMLEDGVRFCLHSPSGDEGFPGNLDVTATYRFDAQGAIEITYTAISDHDTPFSLTNHTYWTLGGAGKKIYPQELRVFARYYLETDSELLPTGQILWAKGTPFDFSQPTVLEPNLKKLPPPLRRTGGYDVSFVRRDSPKNRAAELFDPESGRRLAVETNMPIIHLYTANFLKDFPGKDGKVFGPHDALCLEASYYPDAIHHPHFGMAVLKANQMQTDYIRFIITR